MSVKIKSYPRVLREYMRRRGMGLPMILTALSILVFFSAGMMAVTVQTLRAVNNGERTDRARYAALSGIQSALNRLNSPGGAAWCHPDPRYYEAYGGEPTQDQILTPDQENVLQVTFAGQPDIQALVTVYNNSSHVPSPGYRSTKAPDGTDIPPGYIYIASAGLVGANKKVELSTLGSLVKVSHYEFKDALYAQGEIKLLSGLLDVFDADQAPTGATPPAPEYAGLEYAYEAYLDADTGAVTGSLPAGQGAKVTTSGSDLHLGGGTGNLVMHGDLATGTGGSSDVVAASNVFRQGQSNPGTNANKPIPKAFFPSAAETLGSAGGDFEQSGGPLSLEGGKSYIVSKNFKMDNVELTVSGPGVVSIYVGEDIDIKNSSLNWQHKPANVQIYQLEGANRKATIDNTKGAFLLAGSDSEVELKNHSEIFGAIQGKKITMSDTKLHYDASIADDSIGVSDISADSLIGGAPTTSSAVQGVMTDGQLPPPAPPLAPPAPAPVPAPGAPAPAPGGGCGCGCGCGCLMAEVQCV